jgi:hypothetical protein
MEARVILTIIEELRHGLALDLDPSPSFSRKKETRGNQVKNVVATTAPKYLVMGNSVGLLMAEVRVRAKMTVVTATIPEWRINSGNVTLLKEKAMAAINEHNPTTLI